MTEHPKAKDSLFHSLPFFLALSMSLHSSFPSPDESRSSQIIASLGFCLLPTPPLLAPFLFLSSAPSFHVSSLLPVCSDPLSLDPSLNPRATDQSSAWRKGKQMGGWVGRWGKTVVWEIEALPLLKLDEGATETCRPE